MFLLISGTVTAVAATTPPPQIESTARAAYGWRTDGKPGREVIIKTKAPLTGKVTVDVKVAGRSETTRFEPLQEGYSELRVLLPEGVGVESAAQAALTIRHSGKTITQSVEIPILRYWNVYLYNHAHVDIGYTNTHKNVELLHKTNIIEGVKLADSTAGYTAGAAYKWNPEVTWPLERLWQSDPEGRTDLLRAIKEDKLCIDANYLNLNTTTCSDEEMFHIFNFSRKMEKLTGKRMDVFQQMDIPGMSWGLVPVMAQQGVRYVMSWPNGGDRVGFAHDGLDQQPFWWIGPDGKSKVLFFQPGSYANSGSMGKGAATGRPWFGQRDASRVPAVIKTGSANVDFTAKTAEMEAAAYPYDFLVMSWTLWDNCPLDADIPDAVRDWNDKYAYPHITISGGHQIMEMIETQYGDRIPTVKGDYTEYWTDGLGTAARLTAMNRNAKERLTQAETMWSMLSPDRTAPRAELDEAWRYILLGSEHTWCFENPTEPFFQNAIWKVKQGYFREANDRAQEMFDESLAPATDFSQGGLGPAEGPAKGGISVFNTQSWPRGGVITLSGAESIIGDRVVDEKGEAVPSQRLSTGELLFLASDVPALSSRHYRVTNGEPWVGGKGCTIKGGTLENEHLAVTIDPATGNITQMVKRDNGRDYADAKVNGGLNAFRWLPANIYAPVADTVVSVTTVESGPLVVEMRVDSRARGCRSVSRSVRLVQGQPWVEISNVVDKLPLVAKDGVHFGFGFNLPEAKTRIDIPWGVVELEKDVWKQSNRNWIAMQRWLDMSNDEAGVTWCSLDAPLFEYGKMNANISLSWGSQGPWLNKLEPSSTIYSWVMNNHWHTNFPLTQDGPVRFRYRLLPHEGYNAVQANRFGIEQAQPLVHVVANRDPKITPRVAVDNDNVYVTILKPTDNNESMIVRLRSLSDKQESVRLSYPSGVPTSVMVCDTDESGDRPVGESLTLLPYQMVTLRVSK